MSNVFPSTRTSPLAALLAASEQFNQPKLRRHELWALTCYFRPAALKELVSELKKRVKLTDVYVAYNYAEIFRYDDLLTEINNFKKQFPSINFDVIPVKSHDGIFHSKGYAIIQRDSSAGIRDSVCIVTSGNLTNQGIGTKIGPDNFELSYVSTLRKDAITFTETVDKVWDKFALNSDAIESDYDRAKFRNSALIEARYLCKWEGNLKQELSTRFELSESTASIAFEVNPELRRLGFEADTSTLSKCYFDLTTARPKRPFPKLFLKQYAVKSIIGHWCPIAVWKVAKELSKSDFNNFERWLISLTEPSELENIKTACEHDLVRLNEIGIKVKKHPFEPLNKRISDLVKNRIKQERMYFELEEFPLPHDLDDDAGLDSLYGSLIETIESKNKSSPVAKMLKRANEKFAPAELKLSDAELLKLKKFLQ